MEFRRYQEGIWQSDPATSKIMHEENPESSTNFLRKAIYLPPRSMLLLSGEARYAWNHYIPHHKVSYKLAEMLNILILLDFLLQKSFIVIWNWIRHHTCISGE